MARPKLRTPELRDRVLQSTVGLLADAGVRGLTARRVAAEADTSVAAVYELFGDKAGLAREVFFEGFRRLARRLAEVEDSDDPRADLLRCLGVVRGFVKENPVLAEVMFSRPVADFDPGPDELAGGAPLRETVVRQVERNVDGDGTDLAHVLLALVQGLAAQETAGWLGSTDESVERRWTLAFTAVLSGVGVAPGSPQSE